MTKEIKKLKEDIENEFKSLAGKYARLNKGAIITRDWWRKNTKFKERDMLSIFGSFSGLKESVDLSPIIKRRFETDIVSKSSGVNKTYFVTSVVEGSDIHPGFYKTIDSFCNITGAQKVLLWVRGVKVKDSFSPDIYESIKPFLCTEFIFNNKLKAKDFMLHPSQILPLTGLSRFGNRDCSLIISSTKQHMTSVPREKNSRPHTIWSTGTVSVPKYSNTRSGSLASQDNILGGLIVEVEDSSRFYIRPVQYKDGGFIDLGTFYHENGTISRVNATAIVWGDLHLTEEDKDAVSASIEQTIHCGASRVMLHDVCSWNSVNRHGVNKFIVKAGEPVKSLESDYVYSAKELDKYIDIIKEKIPNILFNVVKSNHDEWVKIWVENGNFIKDKVNSIYGALAFIDFCNGKDPIKEEITKRMKNKKHIYFMSKDESLKVSGYELGQHGSNGANGTKGDIVGFGRSHDKIIVGHSHSPRILYNAIQVGTNSKLVLPYNVGASSWCHSNCIVYPNGTYQLITFIDKKWKLK